jgi:hypothetical protein
MQSRFLVPFSALCVGLPVIVLVLPRLLIPQPVGDSIGDYVQWEPSAAQIRQAVGGSSAGPYTDERHKQFAKMFQARFRNKGKAVGISFSSDHGVRAKFAASIPRWDMAAVSLDLHREASVVFDRDINVDIFETYISMKPVKLAELRAARSGQVSIQFDPRFAREGYDPAAELRRFIRQLVLSSPITPKNLPNPMVWYAQAQAERRQLAIQQMASRVRPLFIQPPSLAVVRQ